MAMKDVKDRVLYLQARVQKLDDLCDAVYETEINTQIVAYPGTLELQQKRIQDDFQSFQSLLLTLHDQMALVSDAIAMVNSELNKNPTSTFD